MKSLKPINDLTCLTLVDENLTSKSGIVLAPTYSHSQATVLGEVLVSSCDIVIDGEVIVFQKNAARYKIDKTLFVRNIDLLAKVENEEVTPLADVCLCERIETNKKTKSGILIVEEKGNFVPIFKIIKKGKDVSDSINIGDCVLADEFGGSVFSVDNDNKIGSEGLPTKSLYLYREKFIFGIFDKDTDFDQVSMSSNGA